ncbi:DUF1444 family protein [Chitinophaga sp. S165]|uniref:DUF1444 family protein n=1 Tax=Chitinophaga sp. S165 TaxID=2135462 RepID=UPI001305041E|nr:DUF1444 family protein [Chitinophaga sp. S165]
MKTASSMGILNRLFGRFLKLSSDDRIDLTKVFPKIKGLYEEDTPDPKPVERVIEMSHDDSPVYETISTGLGIFYVLDKGSHYSFLQNRDLSTTITLEKLHEIALNNLTEQVLDKTQLNGDPADIMMLVNGGNFEATMILVDRLWSQVERLFNDQICIALPARDLLFISGRNNPVGRESLRAAVRKAFDSQDLEGALVRHIYARENNQWILIETV